MLRPCARANALSLTASGRLFAFLDALAITHSTMEHRPLFTVEEGRDLHTVIPGLHCKNLFLKNKKRQIWLVVMPGDKRANLPALEKKLDSGRLSFGSAALLMEILGVLPGAVTPFALINDEARQTTVVLDSDMMQAETVNFHPLRNNASTTILAADLVKFTKALGFAPLVLDCGEMVNEGTGK